MKWFECPFCGQKMFKIADDAECHGIHIKCKGRNCGQVVLVEIPKKEKKELSR